MHQPMAPQRAPPQASDAPGFWLQPARWIELIREPDCPEALALVAAAVPIVMAHSARKRPVGPKGAGRLQQTVGTILAGVLRPYLLRDHPVEAQRGKNGGCWAHSPAIGNVAFWAVVDAMRAAGLLNMKVGISISEGEGSGDGFSGIPTKLWPTQSLLVMAKEAGLTERSRWKVTVAAEQRPIEVTAEALVTIKEFDSEETILEGTLTPLEQAELKDMRTSLRALNAAAKVSDIRGCLRPAFHRSFRGGLAFGGRLYATGAGNYQNMPPADRAAITIAGQDTVELDISAAYLTILMGLTGTTELPHGGDLYALEGFPRDACKKWFTQSFSQGKLAGRWSKEANLETGLPAPKLIRKAALEAYPGALRGRLADILLTPAMRATLPLERHAKAAGQRLPNIEAGVIEMVVDHFVQTRRIALPVHDSVIVRHQDAEEARHVLAGAFKMKVGLTPKIRG
jgi:hypothetical protein